MYYAVVFIAMAVSGLTVADRVLSLFKEKRS